MTVKEGAKRDSGIITSIYTNDGKSPGVVVPRDPEPEDMPELLDFLASETGLMWGALDYSELDKYAPPGEKWEWEEYQIEHMGCVQNYISNKPRQVGLSASFSAKAFARGTLTEGSNYNAIFTSYKKEEAIGKVRYVKQFLGALPPSFRKKIIRDPQQLIEWENYDGTRSKIISHAQRPIRGVHGDIFLDELAFYQFADIIYESAFAATEMMGGTIDITSTPFGKFGKFHEIVEGVNKYPDFFRRWIYWWECSRYLKDPPNGLPMEAWLAWVREEAQTIPFTDEGAEERVYKYGNDKIKRLFRNATDTTSFRQEFEGYFVDEVASFFSKELIMRCMFPTSTSLIDDYDPLETDFTIPVEEALAEENWPIVEKYENVNFRMYSSLEELYAAVERGEVSHNLLAGVDIGTTEHSTQFTVLEEIQFSDGRTLQVERYSETMTDWLLPDQQKYFASVLRDGQISRMRMDCTGIGMHIGQALTLQFPGIFEALQMGGHGKQEREMINLKARLDNMALAIGYDRQKISDLHSIRREVSAQKTVSYKADSKGRHHADYAWAIAFASLAGTRFGDEAIELNLQSMDEHTISVQDSLGSSASFVDKFRKDHLSKVDNVGFGNSLSVSLEHDLIMRDGFSPGDFIKNWDE